VLYGSGLPPRPEDNGEDARLPAQRARVGNAEAHVLTAPVSGSKGPVILRSNRDIRPEEMEPESRGSPGPVAAPVDRGVADEIRSDFFTRTEGVS
jgi:hypothetical protein